MTTSSSTIDLNVGGVHYTTSLTTLVSAKESLLCSMFEESKPANDCKDNLGRVFIDRDGVLFRYILDYLRNRKLVLPENFSELSRLRLEAEYYRLPELIKLLDYQNSKSLLKPTLGPIRSSPSTTELADNTGSITVGYRGTFAFGRDGLAEIKFRRLCRLLVCGKVNLCRAVFRDTLNENRDADRGDGGRYSCRFYLKHNFLEQAFDMLIDAGFELKAACGTGTNTVSCEHSPVPTSASMPSASNTKTHLPQLVSQVSEEGRWYHYNEFVWVKAT